MMNTVRFYVRNADGSIEEVAVLEKGFSIMGEPKTWVLEFDPPLHCSSGLES